MPGNIAQRMTDALHKFAENTEPLDLDMAEFLGEMAAAIIELDATKADAAAITNVKVVL